jgi:hypothetical protein
MMPLVAALLLAIVSSPVLAQTSPSIDQTRFADLVRCVQQSIPVYDDKISSADAIARALMKVCTASTQSLLDPDNQTLLEAVQDAALVSVLQARVEARSQDAASPAAERSKPNRRRRASEVRPRGRRSEQIAPERPSIRRQAGTMVPARVARRATGQRRVFRSYSNPFIQFFGPPR